MLNTDFTIIPDADDKRPIAKRNRLLHFHRRMRIWHRHIRANLPMPLLAAPFDGASLALLGQTSTQLSQVPRIAAQTPCSGRNRLPGEAN
jgi:hypothetical protein